MLLIQSTVDWCLHEHSRRALSVDRELGVAMMDMAQVTERVKVRAEVRLLVELLERLVLVVRVKVRVMATMGRVYSHVSILLLLHCSFRALTLQSMQWLLSSVVEMQTWRVVPLCLVVENGPNRFLA